MPPAPVPTITPILSRSPGPRASKSMPESLAASSVAKNAIGIARWTRSLSFLDMNRSKSKPLTSAATRHESFDASKRVIGPVPLIPRAVASQNASRPIPLGLTAPIPVTTTLFNSIQTLLFTTFARITPVSQDPASSGPEPDLAVLDDEATPWGSQTSTGIVGMFAQAFQHRLGQSFITNILEFPVRINRQAEHRFEQRGGLETFASIDFELRRVDERNAVRGSNREGSPVVTGTARRATTQESR